MKRILSLFLLITFLNMCTPIYAKTIEVKSGTSIPVTVKTEYTSKNVEAGQRINAIIDDNVKIDGVIVFKKGDNATLNISNVKKAYFVGLPGYMEIFEGSVTDINGEKHPIYINQEIKGEEKNWPKVLTGLGVVTVVLIPLALFGLVKGKEAKISPEKVMEVSTEHAFQLQIEKL